MRSCGSCSPAARRGAGGRPVPARLVIGRRQLRCAVGQRANALQLAEQLGADLDAQAVVQQVAQQLAVILQRAQRVALRKVEVICRNARASG